MSAMDNIGMEIGSHGRFQTSAARFDLLIRAYLPASPAELREKVNREAVERGHEPGTYDDLQTVTECLLVLGEFSGYATN